MPVPASACMYSQWLAPEGSDSTRSVGKRTLRCSFSMLLMLVPLGSRPRNRVVGSGRAIAHAGDATPARRWNRGEKSSASGRGATGGSGSGTIRHVPGLERFLHRVALSRRAGQGSGLGRRGVPQLAAQDLADVRLGQLGAELDVL